MQLTKLQLKKIIKEEISKLNEAEEGNSQITKSTASTIFRTKFAIDIQAGSINDEERNWIIKVVKALLAGAKDKNLQSYSNSIGWIEKSLKPLLPKEQGPGGQPDDN
tara:strand:- start:306 stop:626 length:321 start_codon:yes stop_codon:yes gene_type:complete